jgi:hypothetical protein
MWLYGSGFPKSHDISKAIDRQAGAEREVVGNYVVGGTAAKGKHKGRAASDADEPLAAAASITPEQARARFANFQNSMNEPAPAATVEEVTSVTDAPVTDGAVDTSEEDNMNAVLQAKVDALQVELSAKVEAESLAAQVAEDTAKEIETLKAEVERLSAEVANKDNEINVLRSEQKSAGEQAAAIVASVGIDPVAAAPVEPELSAAKVFAAMEGPEATAFYRANKAAILKTFYS